uniref:Uncharacterized protein n=1 Tax=Chromera velia CCMP2878 TaxID=1169474 RepID=A0A0G4I6G0_9ALVE|eukprot:Cvel_11405.t1-p1 / transcript=Cvel_11405.t1 / gene=Cvel_11405 / organism=Chromera_velia_CCMP2878 / gene_product=hypothetical protein / transcript_product=hypothetical protein / location=Cvel_scaffold716:16438-24296(+) / protein_length=580 / sequence_SO=supercontig / SO=protein_coding / is_pseudo=false
MSTVFDDASVMVTELKEACSLALETPRNDSYARLGVAASACLSFLLENHLVESDQVQLPSTKCSKELEEKIFNAQKILGYFTEDWDAADDADSEKEREKMKDDAREYLLEDYKKLQILPSQEHLVIVKWLRWGLPKYGGNAPVCLEFIPEAINTLASWPTRHNKPPAMKWDGVIRGLNMLLEGIMVQANSTIEELNISWTNAREGLGRLIGYLSEATFWSPSPFPVERLQWVSLGQKRLAPAPASTLLGAPVGQTANQQGSSSNASAGTASLTASTQPPLPSSQVKFSSAQEVLFFLRGVFEEITRPPAQAEILEALQPALLKQMKEQLERAEKEYGPAAPRSTLRRIFNQFATVKSLYSALVTRGLFKIERMMEEPGASAATGLFYQTVDGLTRGALPNPRRAVDQARQHLRRILYNKAPRPRELEDFIFYLVSAFFDRLTTHKIDAKVFQADVQRGGPQMLSIYEMLTYVGISYNLSWNDVLGPFGAVMFSLQEVLNYECGRADTPDVVFWALESAVAQYGIATAAMLPLLDAMVNAEVVGPEEILRHSNFVGRSASFRTACLPYVKQWVQKNARASS